MLFFLIGLPIILMIVVWMMFRRTRDQIMGGNGFLSSFSRSTAKRYEPNDQQTTFADVAGLEGVKADLQEIVDFLKAQRNSNVWVVAFLRECYSMVRRERAKRC